MSSHSVLLLLGFVVWALPVGMYAADFNECSAADERCDVQQELPQRQQQCGGKQQGCLLQASLYAGGGGSAQAYKPNAPIKSFQHVCHHDDNNVGRKAYYNVATWPWSRRSRSIGPPRLLLDVTLWSCSSTDDNKCCCTPFSANADQTLEVWQARSDGTYSSISPGQEEGDCRATVKVSRHGRATIETVAPGSTGSLGGLGPFGWDFSPFGPPVVHMLVTADSHDPKLIHLPVLLDQTTLTPRPFRWSEWRGMGFVTTKNNAKTKESGYNVTAWTANKTAIQVTMDIYMRRRNDDEQSRPDLKDALCPSPFYGLPSSFFFEPIAVCAPSMLDFFAL